MDIEVLTKKSGAAAITSLFRWLSRDADVRRNVSVSLSTAGTEGAMGSLDLINAVLTQTVSIASLAVAIASWRDSRAEHPPVRLTVGGKSLVIINDSADGMTNKIFLLCNTQEEDDPRNALYRGPEDKNNPLKEGSS